ncbi:hypothetical protein BH09ACT7_BH09ACT7_54820 [soil metagenome]
MLIKARSGRLVAGALAAGIAGVVGFSGATAAAEPALPQPVPAPVTVTAPPATAADVLQASAPAAAAQSAALPGTAPQAVAPTAAPALPVVQTPALVPATSGTLTDFLKDKGVTLEPQNARDFRALNITLPVPTGWTQVPDPNVPDAFVVIADRQGGDGLYTSNAQVVIYKLVGGEFDPNDAITHGFIDSTQQSNWQTTDASLTPFGAFPSSKIEGAFRQNDMMLSTSRRHIIATAGPDKYLVSMSVTTAFSQAVAAAGATDAILNGFRVTNPAAVVPTPAPAALPVPGSAPAVAEPAAALPAPAAAPVLPAPTAVPALTPIS